MKLFVECSKAPEQPQSSARPICHSHTMTNTGREPATIRIAAYRNSTHYATGEEEKEEEEEEEEKRRFNILSVYNFGCYSNTTPYQTVFVVIISSHSSAFIYFFHVTIMLLTIYVSLVPVVLLLSYLLFLHFFSASFCSVFCHIRFITLSFTVPHSHALSPLLIPVCFHGNQVHVEAFVLMRPSPPHA